MNKVTRAAAWLPLVLLTTTAPVLAETAADKLTVAISTEPKDLDPCSIVSSGIGIILRQNVVETLTTLDPSDSTPLPKLATSWEALDNGAWRFKIREGVTFHDGRPLTANDVKASIERQSRPELLCSSRTKLPNTTYSFNVIDDHTLEVLPEPREPLLPVFLSFVGISPADTPVERVRAPIGTGPFAFANWQETQSVALDTFKGYWGEHPSYAGITYVFRKDSALRSAMVDAGEADVALDLAVQDATSPELDQTYLNGETTRIRLVLQPPLDDIRVRKALNLAFDRQALIGTVLSADVVPATQLILPKVVGYNPDIKVWPYDPDEARRLLAEARADGVPVDQEIRLIGRAGYFANCEEVLQAMAQMWTDVGFKIKLEMMEHAEWNKLVNKPYDAARPALMIQEMHDNNNGDAAFSIPFKFRSDGGHSEISDPKVDALIDEATQSSGEKRAAAFREVTRIVEGEMVSDVMQYHMVSVMKVSPRIEFHPGNAAYSGLMEMAGARILPSN